MNNTFKIRWAQLDVARQKENIEFIGVSRLDDVFMTAIKGVAFTDAKSSVKFAPHDVIIKNRRSEADEIR